MANIQADHLYLDKNGDYVKPGDVVLYDDNGKEVECVVLSEDYHSIDMEHILEASSVHCKRCDGDPVFVCLCDCSAVPSSGHHRFHPPHDGKPEGGAM
jgi:hypothetical protein